MDPQVTTHMSVENQDSSPQSFIVTEARRDDPSVSMTQSQIGTKLEETKVSSSAPVVLEVIDASLAFSQRSSNDGSLTFVWEGNKDASVHSDGCKSEGPLVFSQAHSLIEVLQELLRPSGAPLQIFLDSQNVDEASGTRNPSHVTTNTASKEVIIGTSNAVTHSLDIKASGIVNGETEPSAKQGTIIENPRKSDTPTFQLIHKCCYCRFRSETVAVVLEHVRKKHPGKPAKTKAISGRDCPYCGLRLDQTAFFQHMRQFHQDSHPFRCGYCNFMARDLNQLKHHCTKKHRGESFKAYRRRSSESQSTTVSEKQEIIISSKGDSIDGNRNTSDITCEARGACSGEKCENLEMIESLGDAVQICPICEKKFKTLKYLKVHLRVHNKGRFKCGYCSYISAYCLKVLVHCKKHHRHLQPRVKQLELDPLQDKNIAKNYDVILEEVKKKCSKQPPDPDTRKWARKYSCPTCEYTCSYGASYRRHLTTHSENPLPYRCQYCPFAGREKYYVRRHIQRVHRGLPAVVVENNEDLAQRGPSDVKKNLPPCRAPLRNRKSQIPKKMPKVTDNAKNCAKKSEVGPGVNSCAIVPSDELLIEEQLKDGKNVNLQRKNDVSLPSSRSDTEEASGVCKNIFGPNECPSINVSREKKDSYSAEFSEGYNNQVAVVFNSNRDAKQQLQNRIGIPPVMKSKEVRKILPVQATVTEFSTNLKKKDDLKNSAEGNQEAVVISDHLVSGSEVSNVSLMNVLNVTENINSEVVFSQTVREEQSNNVGLKSVKDVDATIAEKCATNAARKKGSREKSSHRAWDFVAYRDGRYTYCVCGTRTVNKAFYKHIKKHIDFKRFGCGHCSYRSIERAKVKVHHTLVHPGLPLNVNEFEKKDEESMDRNHLVQSLSYFSKVAKSSQLSNVAKESSSSNLSSPIFQCPICKKKISYHTFTIRRHLFSHCDYRPYKCGRCEFRGCSSGEVKQHSVFHGADLCPIVEPSGQQPPEGLEQLVTDCFNELRMKLGKKVRRRSKSNVKLINPVAECVEEEVLNPNGYQLVTSEANIWNQSLSDGVCPWCQLRISSAHSSINEPSMRKSEIADIRSHFKDHFYKECGDSPSIECRAGEVEPSSSTPTGSLKEKDTIIMNGLMYYFMNQPSRKESKYEKTSHANETGVFKGEIGIINNPDGMPPGTIQVTDLLLADLRYLLWGHMNEPKPRIAHWHSCQQCKQQFRSPLALKHHAKSHANCDSFEMMEVDKQCDFQKQTATPSESQAPDGDVGVYFLEDDIEVATAVVVINSEAGERESVLEVSS